MQAAVLGAVLPGGVELPGGTRRDEGIGVDLAVRVVQRHAYGLALVLEDEDVLHEVQGAELLVAVGPHLDEVADASLAHPGQSGVVLVRVEDDLADPAPGSGGRERAALLLRLRCVGREGREPVLEDRYLVGLSGHLRREAPRLGRAEGTVFGGRQKRAVLAVGGVGYPLLERRVPAELVQGAESSP